MAGFRSKGFHGKDLDSHLAEYDDPLVGETADAAEVDDMDAAQKEIAWLRKEVSDLRERLSFIRGEPEDMRASRESSHPWLRIAVTVGATFVLGKVVQRFRSGAAGAGAMIAAQLDHRL